MLDKALYFISKILAQYETEYSINDLRNSWIMFFGLFLVLGFPDFTSIIHNDPEWFNPPFLSPAYFIGVIPAEWILNLIATVTLLSAVSIMTGFYLRISSFLFLISFVLGTNYFYSFGKVDHADIFIPVIAFLGLITNWGKNKRLNHGAFFFIVSFTLGLAFFTAGLAKLLSGWLVTSDQQLKYIIINYSIGLNQGIFGEWILKNLTSNFLWEVLDWTAVVFEMGLIITIWKPKWIKRAIIVCLGFHLFNAYFLAIYFKQIMLIYLFLLPTERIMRDYRKLLTGILLVGLSCVLLFSERNNGAIVILETVKSHYVWLWAGSGLYVLLLVLNEVRPKKIFE